MIKKMGKVLRIKHLSIMVCICSLLLVTLLSVVLCSKTDKENKPQGEKYGKVSAYTESPFDGAQTAMIVMKLNIDKLWSMIDSYLES